MNSFGALLVSPALVVVGSLLAGFLLGYPLQALCVGLAGCLAWQLFQLWRLRRWLGDDDSVDAPTSGGIWGRFYTELLYLKRSDRGGKRQVKLLLQAFRKSADSLPDGIVILNRDHELLWVNRAAAELLGLQRGRDHGQRITNLIRRPKFLKYMTRRKFSAPYIIKSMGSEKRRLSLRIIPGDEQEMLVVRDITSFHQVEKMRRDFVANVSHELRTPLTVISGYIDEMLSDETLIGAWRPQLDTLKDQSERMQAIVTDLLRLSKLESAGTEAEYNSVLVPELLSRICREIAPRYGGPDRVVIEIADDTPILGEAQELYSAFSNLVDNALKYTGPEDQVRVRYTVDDAGGHVAVTDPGPGISAKHIPRLTERFYRVDKGRDRERGGTGLGLAIVKHVLQRHDARLDISSELGKGSTFSCHFPPERMADDAAKTEMMTRSEST